MDGVREVRWLRPDGTVLFEAMYHSEQWPRPEPRTDITGPIEGPYEIVDRPVDWPA
jgi:hypothetical protein